MYLHKKGEPKQQPHVARHDGLNTSVLLRGIVRSEDEGVGQASDKVWVQTLNTKYNTRNKTNDQTDYTLC